MISMTHNDNNVVDTVAPSLLLVVKGQMSERNQRGHMIAALYDLLVSIS